MTGDADNRWSSRKQSRGFTADIGFETIYRRQRDFCFRCAPAAVVCSRSVKSRVLTPRFRIVSHGQRGGVVPSGCPGTRARRPRRSIVSETFFLLEILRSYTISDGALYPIFRRNRRRAQRRGIPRFPVSLVRVFPRTQRPDRHRIPRVIARSGGESEKEFSVCRF